MDLICCTGCGGSLSLLDGRGDGVIFDGLLSCTNCERSYPIKDGIPQFIEFDELADSNRRSARSYDRLSRFYDLIIKITFLAFGGDRSARLEVLDRLELSSGRILEISVGTGMNLPYLFESPGVGEVFGLDISAGQLRRCRELVDSQEWGVDLFLGTAEKLPFLDETFETVFHIGGINFFSGKEQAIAEMIRVAKPGCKIVIADESERLAKFLVRLPGFGGSQPGQELDVAAPIHLVPISMEDIKMIDIWRSHGEAHGYCLEFRKPA